MTAPATERYRQLTEAEQVLFRESCIADGVNPRVQCPLCHGTRLSTDFRFGYCDLHKSWEDDRPISLVVACHRCEVRWAVLLNRPCTEERVDA